MAFAALPSVKIIDLAEVLIEELTKEYNLNRKAISIQTIGVKPGEKMYEELLNNEEMRRTLELDDYYVIKPAFSEMYNKVNYNYKNILSDEISMPYTSENQESMKKEQLRSFLREHSLFTE